MTLDTYAVHGGNLISIELHTLTHRERHTRKRQRRSEHAAREEGGAERRRREGKRHVSTCKESACGYTLQRDVSFSTHP